MENIKLRRRVCFEAARLLQSRKEANFNSARWRALRSITSARVDAEALPTDMEIRHALQQLVSTAMPPESVNSLATDDNLPEDRFERYTELLQPLDRVRLPRDTHPEGDLLYHSLQVFELAREARPWDEEFLIAALLHEVGRGIDPYDAHGATLAAVAPIVTDRTYWLIEQLPLQHRSSDGTMGQRARRRLALHEDGEELRLLASCDSEGRVPGRRVCSLDEAIDFVRQLADEH